MWTHKSACERFVYVTTTRLLVDRWFVIFDCNRRSAHKTGLSTGSPLAQARQQQAQEVHLWHATHTDTHMDSELTGAGEVGRFRGAAPPRCVWFACVLIFRKSPLSSCYLRRLRLQQNENVIAVKPSRFLLFGFFFSNREPHILRHMHFVLLHSFCPHLNGHT